MSDIEEKYKNTSYMKETVKADQNVKWQQVDSGGDNQHHV